MPIRHALNAVWSTHCDPTSIDQYLATVLQLQQAENVITRLALVEAVIQQPLLSFHVSSNHLGRTKTIQLLIHGLPVQVERCRRLPGQLVINQCLFFTGSLHLPITKTEQRH